MVLGLVASKAARVRQSLADGKSPPCSNIRWPGRLWVPEGGRIVQTVFCEARISGNGQPILIGGDCDVDTLNIPYLANNIIRGVWVDLEAAFAFGMGCHPAVTGKANWDSEGGTRRDFSSGLPPGTCGCKKKLFDPNRWFQPHLSVRAVLVLERWEARLTQVAPCCLKSTDKSFQSSPKEVFDVWDIYDSRLEQILNRYQLFYVPLPLQEIPRTALQPGEDGPGQLEMPSVMPSGLLRDQCHLTA